MKIRNKVGWPLACVVMLVLLGCHNNNQQGTQSPATESNSNAASGANSGAAPSASNNPNSNMPATAANPAASGASATPEAPPEPKEETVTVPEGTHLHVRLADTISSGSATTGSEFRGTLAAPLVVHGVEIARTGSDVTGTVSNAVSSGRLNRPAELSLTLTSLTVASGRKVEISTSTWSQKMESHKKRNAEMIGGGAGVGALIGAIAGKGKGAAIGGLIGGGAGTAGAAVTGKKEIVLPVETKLTFSLAAPFRFTRKVS